MPPIRKPVPKSSYHHGNLVAAVVREATRQVEGEGAERMSLRAIGRRVGVSHAALYHHFPGRDALLAAVAAEGFDRLRTAMLERVRISDGPPLTRLQQAGIAYVLFACANPNLYRLMFSGPMAGRAKYPDLQSAADRAYGTLGQLLNRVSTRSRPATEDLADNAVNRAAWAMVHGLAMLMIDGRFGDAASPALAERVTREVTTVLGRGLRSMM